MKPYFNTSEIGEIESGKRFGSLGFAVCTVLGCGMARFALRFGSFWNAKRPESQAVCVADFRRFRSKNTVVCSKPKEIPSFFSTRILPMPS